MYNLDVEEGNVDVVVPVCPCMFMIETQGVHDLMSHRSFVLYTQKKISSRNKNDSVAEIEVSSLFPLKKGLSHEIELKYFDSLRSK